MSVAENKNGLKKGIIISSVVIVLLLLAVIVGLILAPGKPENSSVIVYRTADSTVIRIKDKEMAVNDSSASDFYCDEENKRVFFTVTSSSEDSLYDICCVDVIGSEISSPVIIDYAVRNVYHVLGDKIYYLKYNNRYDAFEGYECDLSSKVRRAFDTNVEGVYPFENGVFYYTKRHGDSLSLYKSENSGSANALLLPNIQSVNFYNLCEEPHIYLESFNTEKSSKELWYASPSGENKVCDNLYYANYDEYTPCGNLYYYTSSSSSLSWSYVISDEFVESDKEITKPRREDFESVNGISTAYNEEFIKYQDKLIRDEIRTAMNEMVEKYSFNAPVFTAYSVCGGKITKVCEDIDPSRVYAVADFGLPKLVYEKVALDTTSVDMATLVSIYPRNSFDDVISYAWSVVDGAVVSDGMCFACADESGCAEFRLEAFDKKSTVFSFSGDGSKLFSFIKDGSNTGARTVYCNTFGDDMMPSKEVTVSAGVTDYKITDDGIIYLKEDDGKSSGDVFAFDGKEPEKIANAASAFLLGGDGNVFSVKYNNSSSGAPSADYYLCSDGKEEQICTNANIFRFAKPDKSAFIISGELFVYSRGKSASVATGVSDIVLFV